MSKYTNPSGLMDVLIEAMVGLLLLVAIFWLIVWILMKIWLWVLGGLLLALGIWIVVRWRRWRGSQW